MGIWGCLSVTSIYDRKWKQGKTTCTWDYITLRFHLALDMSLGHLLGLRSSGMYNPIHIPPWQCMDTLKYANKAFTRLCELHIQTQAAALLIAHKT